MNELLEKGKSSSVIPKFNIQNPQFTIEMREPTTDSSAVAYAVELLSRYGFELRGYTAQELVNVWLKTYQANWIRLAVIEALYQGRYKAVSVEQILTVWARRGQPIYRFNHEFERLISRKLPQNLTAPLHVALTQLGSDYGLPLLPPSSSDTQDQERDEQVKLDGENLDLEPIVEQDNPSSTTPVTEELAEELVQSDAQASEASTSSTAGVAYDANWSRCETSKPPIHQFTPLPDSSDFYLKLKAVVQKGDSFSTVVEALAIDDEAESEPLYSEND